MTPLQVGLLVVGILVALLLVFVPLLMWVRRRTAEMEGELQRELTTSGERVLAGPCPAVYRGGTAGYSKVKGNGVAALTDRRLIIRKLFGEPVEIPVPELAGVREDKWFLRAYTGGKLHLIVKTKADAEVGLFVGPHAEWMAAIRKLLGETS